VGEAQSFERLRILVVDDNVEGGRLLCALLSQRGHDVVGAVSGEDALRIAKEFLPQVGMLDIGMPGMNSYALAAHFRSDPIHSDMYLVAVTGWGQEEDRIKAFEAGFDAHVTKPADPDELVVLLASRFPPSPAGGRIS
jgi:CheY-like chemotaxis protein